MPEIYGAWASRRDNIVVLGTLTTTAATDAVEVSGRNFTFAHVSTGSNIRTVDEGSLDGTNWFALGDEKTHESTGTYGHHYQDVIIRYARTRCTAIGTDESVVITMACD